MSAEVYEIVSVVGMSPFGLFKLLPSLLSFIMFMIVSLKYVRVHKYTVRGLGTTVRLASVCVVNDQSTLRLIDNMSEMSVFTKILLNL